MIWTLLSSWLTHISHLDEGVTQNCPIMKASHKEKSLPQTLPLIFLGICVVGIVGTSLKSGVFYFQEDGIDVYIAIFLLQKQRKPCTLYIKNKHKKTERWREGIKTRDLSTQGITWWWVPGPFLFSYPKLEAEEVEPSSTDEAVGTDLKMTFAHYPKDLERDCLASLKSFRQYPFCCS